MQQQLAFGTVDPRGALMGVGTLQVDTLADLLGLVQEVFQLAGDATTFQVGGKHDDTIGNAPRVLFVPSKDAGNLGPPAQLNDGSLRSGRHQCYVSVRAAEPGDDVRRLKPAYLLANKVIAAVARLGPGVIEFAPGRIQDNSPSRYDAYGGDLGFQFFFLSPVPDNAAIRRAVRQLTAASPPDPDRPEGDTVTTIEVTMTAEATRS